MSSLTISKANDTAFCGSEHTLSPTHEKQGKRISWKVGTFKCSVSAMVKKNVFDCLHVTLLIITSQVDTSSFKYLLLEIILLSLLNVQYKETNNNLMQSKVEFVPNTPSVNSSIKM